MPEGSTSPRARAIEQELLAPCCWVQTLDVHASPQATELRHEIQLRVNAGEASASIRRDLQERYGQRIVAAPDVSGLPWVAPVMMVLLAVAAVLLVFNARRWVRARDLSPPLAESTAPELASEYDAQLDRELRAPL